MLRVKNEMVAQPSAATVPGSRRDLVRLFIAQGHAGFPVLKDASRKLVGVVTRQHLFENADEAQTSLIMDPNPATTYPEAPLAEAARLFVAHRLRLLPVVNSLNDLVGLLTPHELLRALPPPRGHVAAHLRDRFVPIHQGAPARFALEVFRATRATGLPVLDDAGRYAGLLTDAEMVRHMRVTDGVVRSVAGIAHDSDAWRWEGLRSERPVRHAITGFEAPDLPAGELMARDAPIVGLHAPIAEAAEIMLARHVHQLPVVDNDRRLIDVMGEVDLLAALVR